MKFPPVPYVPKQYRGLPEAQRVTVYYAVTRKSIADVQRHVELAQATARRIFAAHQYAAATERLAKLDPESTSEALAIGLADASARAKERLEALETEPHLDPADADYTTDRLLSSLVPFIEVGTERRVPPSTTATPEELADFWGALHPGAGADVLRAVLSGEVGDGPKG
jgi:hypothetical protein